MPRFLQLVALTLALVVAGAPTWLAEVVEDDCADECSGEGDDTCPDEGCADCSLICSSCPRTHVVVPSEVTGIVAAAPVSTVGGVETTERVPTGPPPRGIFHPPRLA